MYQMNDKVILTKKKSCERAEVQLQPIPAKAREKKCARGEKKGKLNIFCAISAIFLTFNMFFVYLYFQQGLVVGGIVCAEKIYTAFIYLHPRHNQNDHHKWIQKEKLNSFLCECETDLRERETFVIVWNISWNKIK